MEPEPVAETEAVVEAEPEPEAAVEPEPETEAPPEQSGTYETVVWPVPSAPAAGGTRPLPPRTRRTTTQPRSPRCR